MGSSPTLAQPLDPSQDPVGLSVPGAQRAFDRLNPDYGVPADQHNRHGHHAVQQREAALTLGTRVTVATSRENDRDPVIWLTGQDYRAADAIRTTRSQVVRSRQSPQRGGPER